MHHRYSGKGEDAFTPVAAGQCGRGRVGVGGQAGAVDARVGDLDDAAVRAALDAVTDSPGFSRSPRLRRFLRYIVEETLAGRGGSLKEYTIAVDVFERDESYDPQTSSLVRVEASRLRAKLDKYNASTEAGAVTISLPTGTYMPVFTETEAPAETVEDKTASAQPVKPRKGMLIAIAAAAALVAVVIAGHWGMIVDRVGLGTGAPVSDDAGHAHAREVPTIAVLPMRNISDAAEDDFLGVALTDALITSLARGPSLRVIAYASSRRFGAGAGAMDRIAGDLGVSHVVEGTVLREGEVVRITAKLIDVETGRYLWAESYDRPIVELLSLQAELARRIVSSLAAVVTGEGAVPVAGSTDTADPAAQEAYLMGRYFRNMATESGFRKGIAYFKDAIAKDPDFAEAYSGMAACYCVLGGHGLELVDPREGMPLAKQAIDEALRLNDGLAEAHAFAGIIHLKFDWDWDGAERSFRRSIEINPSYAQAHLFYSYFLEAMGDEAGAVREAEAARRLDPLSLPLNINLVWQYLRAGKAEAALERLEWTRDLNPDFWGVHWGYGQYYRSMGASESAIASFERAVDAGGGHALPVADLGYAYAKAGRVADARRMLRHLNELAKTSYVSPYNMAVIHIGLGDRDAAFDALDAAYAARSRSLAWLNVAHEFDAVRNDPRFRDLTQRIGLPL